MRTWAMRDDGDENRHMLVAGLGFVLLLVAAAVLYLGTTRSQWPEAAAQVLSVELRCKMDAVSYSRYSRSGPVYIDCDDVARFRAENAHRHWNLVKLYSGNVRVIGDGQTVTVELGLRQWNGVPRVGDRFTVVQNPDDPRDVQYPDRSLGETLIGSLLGGLGAFVIAIALFWM